MLSRARGRGPDLQGGGKKGRRLPLRNNNKVAKSSCKTGM